MSMLMPIHQLYICQQHHGTPTSSMGKCVEAVGDFDRAIELAPNEPDPNLGRGVARECLGKFAEAIEVGGWVMKFR